MLWSDESKFEIFGSTHRVFVWHRKGEHMVSPCMVPTVEHVPWGCFAGDTVGNSFQNWRPTEPACLPQHPAAIYIPSGLPLVGLSFLLMIPNTPQVCVRDIQLNFFVYYIILFVLIHICDAFSDNLQHNWYIKHEKVCSNFSPVVKMSSYSMQNTHYLFLGISARYAHFPSVCRKLTVIFCWLTWK